MTTSTLAACASRGKTARAQARSITSLPTAGRFQDHLGTALVMVDAWGHVQQQSVYYPFGGERVITNTVANTYKFTGLERDSETGLDHTLNRQYSSTLGRWLSMDPARGGVSSPQTLNRYPYVGNDPTSRSDPQGLCGCDAFSGCDDGFTPACDPSDPSCDILEGPIFEGTVTLNFTCPDNRFSCCAYYTRLEKEGPTLEDRLYAAGAKRICEHTNSSCFNNCYRQCLVNFSIERCSGLATAFQRNFCRLVEGHAFCTPLCGAEAAAISALQGRTFPIPFPVDFTLNVSINYSCGNFYALPL